uniref:Uncharacterized protein n=1 Tax=Glossina austeni TaxID=7395 RepID=A0A1A9UW06_GLOAU
MDMINPQTRPQLTTFFWIARCCILMMDMFNIFLYLPDEHISNILKRYLYRPTANLSRRDCVKAFSILTNSSAFVEMFSSLSSNEELSSAKTGGLCATLIERPPTAAAQLSNAVHIPNVQRSDTLCWLMICLLKAVYLQINCFLYLNILGSFGRHESVATKSSQTSRRLLATLNNDAKLIKIIFESFTSLTSGINE